MGTLNMYIEYPYSDIYEYETVLERINFDEERIKDLQNGNGFIVGPPHGIKKDLKDPDGIFSYRFGPTLKDLSPHSNKYRCERGCTTGKINNGSICPVCGTRVRYVDDNFEYFGWKVLKNPHFVIHPALYKSIDSFFGRTKDKRSRLDCILKYIEQKDADGNPIEDENVKLPKEFDKEPFYGIGMMAFRDRFDEIMDYYASVHKTATKKSYYEDIMHDRDKIFSRSIPVFTFLLRPVDINQKNFCHEDTNDNYVMINRLASSLNKYDDLQSRSRELSLRECLMYDLQTNFNTLYDKLDKILQGKKGALRSLLAGRYNFSSRSVITPDPDLRIDEIKLPYKCLVELLQQRIINILRKTYDISDSDAYNIWYKALINYDSVVANIIMTIIQSSGNGRGLPFIINRNPTISYGGILQMFCVGINYNFTMGLPLQVLSLLAADFDKQLKACA